MQNESHYLILFVFFLDNVLVLSMGNALKVTLLSKFASF